MNGLAIIVGYTVLWLLAALVIAVPVGKLIARRSERGETEQVPPQAPAVAHRRDTGPQDPAS